MTDTNRTNPVPGSLEDLFLHTNKEAAGALRRQYLLDPEQYRDPLANSLSELERRFHGFRRWREAHDTAAEVLDLRRLSYATDPGAYRAKLISSLETFSWYLSMLGTWRDARDVTIEAVHLLRFLYAADPVAHRASLAYSLYRLGIYCVELTLWEDGRLYAAESVDLRRLLYAAGPDAYRDHLIMSLQTLGLCFRQLKLYEDSRAVTAESIGLWRLLYTADPEKYRANLASSLRVLGADLYNLDLWEDARVAAAEAIDLLRILYTVNPAEHRAELAASLHLLSDYLRKLRLLKDARVAIAESVDVGRVLYMVDPKKYHGKFSYALFDLSVCLHDLNLWEDARAAATELIDVQRILFAENPTDTYRDSLAKSLDILSLYLNNLNLWEDARVAAAEAVELRRPMYTANPAEYRTYFIRSLHSLASSFINLKLWEDAQITVTEMIGHLKKLHAAESIVYHVGLVKALSRLGSVHQNLGNLAAADSAEEEAVSLFNLTDCGVQIHQSFGADGFGSVYHAKLEKRPLYWGDAPECEIIIKMLQGYTGTLGFSSDPNTQRQIRREMITWYKLRHRNIVGFVGYATNPTYGFGLVSEYFSGGDIMNHLREVASADQVLLCRDVARGLLYLHTLDPPVIHGDMKPPNIVIYADGHAAICDFGLSYINTNAMQVESLRKFTASSSTASQTLRYITAGYVGTLRYLSPEQLSSDPDIVKPTLAADIYAFACTLAEILTGKQPFASMEKESEIIAAISSAKQPYELLEITERFPDFAFLEKCWAADPMARPNISTVCEWMGVSSWQ